MSEARGELSKGDQLFVVEKTRGEVTRAVEHDVHERGGEFVAVANHLRHVRARHRHHVRGRFRNDIARR